MFKQVSSIISGSILFAVLFLLAFFVYEDEVIRFLNPETAEAELPTAAPLLPAKNVRIPASIEIAVPFSAQAPFGDWGEPWQDACEETSVMMAVAWARGFELVPDLAASEISNEVAFEKKALGYYRDTNAADTARLFKEFYHYDSITVRDSGVNVGAIKKELAEGNIVIVPLAAAFLKNPYFTSPPLYHMVVIRGYDDATQEFITNEPGTKHGNGFRYSYENLFDAIHDWTGFDGDILKGNKVMIIVSRSEPSLRQ